MKIYAKRLKISTKNPQESDSCVNCYHNTNRSDEEPCFSCNRNPQTQTDDNWTAYEYDGKEFLLSQGD